MQVTVEGGVSVKSRKRPQCGQKRSFSMRTWPSGDGGDGGDGDAGAGGRRAADGILRRVGCFFFIRPLGGSTPEWLVL